MNPLPPSFTLSMRPLLVLSLGVGIAFSVGCSRPSEPESTQALAVPDSGNTEQAPQVQGMRNEEQWIVEAIVKELAALASFAADQNKAPLSAEAVTVTRLAVAPSRYGIRVALAEPIQTEVILDAADGSIWNPDRYAPIAAALLKASGIQAAAVGAPSAETGETELISTLSSPVVEGIQKENQRISARLTSHPSDPDAYEQAALVIGLMGLRENSGMFWETRSACNRATAVLAFAQALRGESQCSESGRLGRLLVGLLADTKKESEEAILQLKERAKVNPALAPWAMAAALRNSRDWRVLARPADASLLERIEYLRAVGEAVSPEVAREKLTAYQPEAIPDWSRILMQFDFSVEIGHEIAPKALAKEVREIGILFPEIAQGGLSADRLAAALNRVPEGLVGLNSEGKAEIRVIDNGMWALFFQRHLCHVVQKVHAFLADKWGVKEQADRFRTEIAQLCGQLTLFPLLQETGMGSSPDVASKKAVEELLTRHPEWISDAIWSECARNGDASFPKAQDWFSNGLPTGTAYSFYSRVKTIPLAGQLKLSEMEALYAVAPWHFGVARHYLHLKTGGKPTVEQFREVMGRFQDFNVAAMLDYSKLLEDDPVAFGDALKKAAELDSYYYLRLAAYYVKRNMKPEAASAYEAAIANHADSIAIANQSEWLINYYYDQGRTDDALTLAKMAAEVYSFKGLQAMANLSEKMGDLSVAEDHFQKIHERYENVSPLFLFYQRQVKRDPESAFVPKMKALLATVFPAGLKDAALQDFSGPPSCGVLIKGESALLRKNGLKRGDIITALDGKRVDDFPQYVFVRSLKETPELELIVYQNGAYHTVKANAPERRFNCDFDTYVPAR